VLPRAPPLLTIGAVAASKTLTLMYVGQQVWPEAIVLVDGCFTGAAYGATIGFAMASISTLMGTIVAFLLSRSMLRPVVKRILRGAPRLSSLDGQIGNQGWRFVCLLRLSPVMPFAATSCALGLSSITLGNTWWVHQRPSYICWATC
jgi:uncharacterized membrane protein YdjX (TVP38/TMEM64 family)